MFYTIAIDLIVIWMLGLIVSFTLGGIIYLLPVVAITMIFISLINDRRISKTTITDLMNSTSEMQESRK